MWARRSDSVTATLRGPPPDPNSPGIRRSYRARAENRYVPDRTLNVAAASTRPPGVTPSADAAGPDPSVTDPGSSVGTCTVAHEFGGTVRSSVNLPPSTFHAT